MANRIKRSSKIANVSGSRVGGQLEQASRVTTNNAAKRVKTDLPVSHFSVIHKISANEKITIIKEGVSKNDLEKIKELSSLDYDSLSNILSVSRAKLLSKKGADKFDRATSERIMLLADVVAYGQSIFESKDAFNEWMKKSNLALGGKSPLHLMDTIYGIHEVKKELGRIEYGVF